MSFFDKIFKRDSELGWMFDLELFQKTSNRAHMKRLAIDTCIAFIARTISQTEFRVRNGDTYEKDELYYRLNTRPNKNMTASTFWEKFIYKLIYDNEILIIQADDGDLLIAEDFVQKEFAVYEDIFSNVVVRDFEFNRTFKQSEVIHLKYTNERLEPLLDSLFADYGDLFGMILNGQKRKNQIRATVNLDSMAAKDKGTMERLQKYINTAYQAIENKDVAIIPQQPGFEYEEASGNGVVGQSVDEINKVTNGFFNEVAAALGIPVSLIRGDMADVANQTKNYMFFTISPLLKKIKDEGNVKFFTKEEFMNGKSIEARKPSYRDIFDLATAVDKLRASGIMNGHEIRSELGLERVENNMLDEYVMTKNYHTSNEALEGGENE